MTDLWAGEFGNEYTRRNAGVALTDARETIWRTLIPRDCQSVMEIGANIGRNLEAIAHFSACDLYACEPNEMARGELYDIGIPRDNITADYADKLSFPDRKADLVFTCGVLIHVPPDKLLPSMREIHRCARRWVICGEYFAPSEEMIPYRGHDNAMWRRDYGSLWLDNFDDLHCTATLFAWKRMTGLDNITFWAFKKGQRRH